MEYFLGIDIGGTNVKFGLVNSNGELLEKRKYPTIELRKSENFEKSIIGLVRKELESNPEVKKVGIGVPGMINKERTRAIRMANLPEMNGFDLIPTLNKNFPSHTFRLENDANAAALGEYHFGLDKVHESFLFVTLGTGVGSAAIIDGKIFVGADGNGMELGHIICSAGGTLEQQIGKPGLVRMADELLESGVYDASILFEKKPLNSKRIVKACLKGDPVGREVFSNGGSFLGEGLVTAIRLLDIKKIYLGGGVSQTFDHIINPAKEVLERFLPPYYLKDLDIRIATLGNNAGIIGAASLCFSFPE